MSIVSISPKLSDAIFQATDAFSFPRRLWNAMRVIERLDPKKAVLIGLTLIASTIHVLFVNAFLAKGVFHSVREVALCTDEDRITCIAPLGNAAGWSTEFLAELLLLETIYRYVIREGEFYVVKKLCETVPVEDAESASEEEKNWFLNSYNEQRFFPNVTIPLSVPDSNPLHPHFRILATQLAAIPVFSCLKRAPFTFPTALRALPTVLFSLNALGSLVGEIGLGKIILGHKQELSETGHLGEWLANGAVALFMAANFPRSLIHEGLFVIAKDLFVEKLELCVNDPLLYNEVRTRAQEVLVAIANRGFAFGVANSFLPTLQQRRAISEPISPEE